MSEVEQIRKELDELLAKDEATKKEYESILLANEQKKRALTEKLRGEDLATVRELCARHGFTVGDLAGVIKTNKRSLKTKTAAQDGIAKRRGRPKGSKNKVEAVQ